VLQHVTDDLGDPMRVEQRSLGVDGWHLLVLDVHADLDRVDVVDAERQHVLVGDRVDDRVGVHPLGRGQDAHHDSMGNRGRRSGDPGSGRLAEPAELIVREPRVACRVLPLSAVPRAVVDRDTRGVIKLVAEADSVTASSTAARDSSSFSRLP
jgi:hypothetical protein